MTMMTVWTMGIMKMESRHGGNSELDRELESIIRRRRRSSANILQLLQGIRAGLASESQNSELFRDRDRDRDRNDKERVILINPFTVQGQNENQTPIGSLGDYFIGSGLDLLLQHLAENDPNMYGTLPAKKVALEALPTVMIKDNFGFPHSTTSCLYRLFCPSTRPLLVQHRARSHNRSTKNMASAVPKLLNKSNYSYWRDVMKVYLESQDLWDVVSSEQRPSVDDCDKFKAWKINDAKALHAIMISCEEQVFDKIRDKPTAKEAWTALGKDFCTSQKHREAPGIGAPSREAPGIGAPSREAPKIEAPSREAPGIEAPSREAPKIEAPSREAPGIEAPSREAPGIEAPSREAPGIEAPSTSTINVLQSDVENADKDYKDLVNALSTRRVDGAIELCQRNPNLLKERLPNSRNAPVLHELIMLAGRRWEGKVVEMLGTDQFPIEALDMKTSSGDTPITIAAQVGAINIAELLVRIKPSLVSEPNKFGLIPVIVAICSHNFLKMADFLFYDTPKSAWLDENGKNGATLITKSLEMRKLDLALDLLREYPHLALNKDINGISPVYAAACAPSLFCRKRLRFWPSWIRQSLFKALFINPAINITSSEYSPATIILEIMEQQIRASECLVYDAFFEAIRRGNFNFIVMLMKANIQISEELDDMSRNIYMHAIEYRQAEIFSLIFWEKDDDEVTLSANLSQDKWNNNLLHMAATLAPPTAFDGISGPALHLQRELRWFKEVEKLVPPSALTSKNSDGMTPRELFTKNHKDLVVAGEKWMKDTAYSCTIIAPLIVTIMFAAAFQVPGGNDEHSGSPIFLNKTLFKLYMVSVATSLFSATTSVLVFLKILTSNYGEEDFFKSLPRRMITGLSTLFFISCKYDISLLFWSFPYT